MKFVIKALTFLILLCFVCTEGSRKISCFVNPGLKGSNPEPEESRTNVVHISSEGQNDVIHYVWSTYKLPSVIVARTTKNTTLLINSKKLISFEKDAIVFENGEPLEAIGVTFSTLWELHYEKESENIQDIHTTEDLDLMSFNWTDVNESLDCSSSFASVTLNGNNSDLLFSDNGKLQIKFSVSADQELSDEFPRLIFTGNSTLLKFIFNNFHSNYSFTRYGFEVSLFTILGGCKINEWKKNIYESINDETSPGVFSDVEFVAPCSNEASGKSSFISWRPVAYTGVKPIVANSSDVNIVSDLIPSSVVDPSIACLYFKDKTVFNITFGTAGDGFYAATKYSSWTVMIGTGTMVEVSLSTFVIILASVGIGLLALFFVAGSVFILYRRCKDKDDDLLLN